MCVCVCVCTATTLSQFFICFHFPLTYLVYIKFIFLSTICLFLLYFCVGARIRLRHHRRLRPPAPPENPPPEPVDDGALNAVVAADENDDSKFENASLSESILIVIYVPNILLFSSNSVGNTIFNCFITFLDMPSAVA